MVMICKYRVVPQGRLLMLVPYLGFDDADTSTMQAPRASSYFVDKSYRRDCAMHSMAWMQYSQISRSRSRRCLSGGVEVRMLFVQRRAYIVNMKAALRERCAMSIELAAVEENHILRPNDGCKRFVLLSDNGTMRMVSRRGKIGKRTLRNLLLTS